MKKLKWIICSCCEGNGTVDHPAFSNGFTSSEWSDMHPDERDAYMAGAYDERCEACQGLGRVQVPNVAVMTFAEKRELVIERREAREDARVTRMLESEIEAERSYGC